MSSMLMTDEEHDFVVKRLDRKHIEELAAQAREKLQRGQAVECCYTPGDATWYSLVLARVDHVLGAYGGGTGKKNALDGDPAQSYIGGEGTYVLVYSQHEKATYFDTSRQDWEWIASTVCENRVSAVAIGQFLEAVFGS